MPRLGLNLNLSDNRSEGQSRKKISIGLVGNGGLCGTPQEIDVSVALEKQGYY
jgi:hypothetical protein